MVEKPPLRPEETPITTGLSNAIKFVLKNVGKTNPIGTALQVMKPTEVGDATLEGKESLVQQAIKKWESQTPTQEYETGRGSLYQLDDNNRSIRLRSGDNHSDKTTGIQPESNKTIFLDTKNKKIISKYMGSLGEDMTLEPTGPNKAVIIRNTAYGPKKVGKVATINYSSKPKVGDYPFEIGEGRSRAGEDLRLRIQRLKDGTEKLTGQHLGSPITKIINKQGGGSVIMSNPYNYNPRGI